MGLRIVPLTFRRVCAYVAEHHRHNKPPRGGKVFLGARDATGKLVGVGVLGRPNARALDADGETCAEITRTCTDGALGANSLFYGAFRKIAKAMGYQRVITYTRIDESGVSLHAAGFVRVKELPPRKNWANSSKKLRHLRDASEEEQVGRVLWEVRFGEQDG